MYDDIAEFYHLVYEDWDRAIASQAGALDRLFVDTLGLKPRTVLDVSCGIGTQALGLAERGYQVTGSDLSAGAIARAQREGANRELSIEFSVADMRDCSTHHQASFDIVLSADNSIPHLEGLDAVRQAIAGFYQCLVPGGVAVVGIRDYRSDENRESPQVWPYGVREQDGRRVVVFQTRDWFGDSYRVGMYFVREATREQPAEVVAGTSTYHAITVAELMEIFGTVGFVDVRRYDDVMHQPLVVGVRG